MPDIFKAVQSEESFEGGLELSKIGLKATSSFPGFCSFHDSNLFSSIDDPDLKITCETSQLLIIRTFVQEAYKKICAQYKLDSFQHKDLSVEVERKSNVAAFQLGYTDLMVQAKELYANMKSGDCNIKYLNINFSQTLPFCFIAPLNLEIKPSFGGKDPSAHALYESCLIGLIPNSTGSNFVLAFPSSQANSIKLLLKRIGYQRNKFPTKLLQLALESCENLFFKPSWAKSLSVEQKKLMKKVFLNDLGVADLLSRSLIPENAINFNGKISISTNTLSINSWKKKLKY